MVKRFNIDSFKTSVLFSVLLMLCSFTAQALTITAKVDRNPVKVNESFKIIFEADDNVSVQPSFDELKEHFHILSQNQSSNVQIINGSMSRQTRWTVFAMAKKPGTQIVPSVAFGNKRSNPLRLVVKPEEKAATPGLDAQGNQLDLFVETEVDRSGVYVQSQVIYTIRFYRATNVAGASMSEPKIEQGEALIERLGDDSSFELRRKGKRFVVIERKYALFPQKSGKLTLAPISMDLQISQHAPRNYFDPFNQNTFSKRITSNSSQVDVKAMPNEMWNKPWLPASAVTLSEKWSDPALNFTVGEPITRTLTMRAEGLTGAQLPSLQEETPKGFKSYPDQPRINDKRLSNGISGTRQEKIALIPTKAGTLTLPAIEVPWWNTNTNKIETLSLPSRTVRVKAAAKSAQTAAPTPPPAPAATTPQPTETTTPAETLPADTAAAESDSLASTPPASGDHGIWFKSTIALTALWLLTLLLWFLSNRSRKTGSHESGARPPKASLNTVKKACAANNPQASKTALLNWAKGTWPEDTPENLSEIGKRLDENCREQLALLNRALYSSEASNWKGEALWQALSAAAKNIKQQNKGGQRPALIPLYP